MRDWTVLLNVRAYVKTRTKYRRVAKRGSGSLCRARRESKASSRRCACAPKRGRSRLLLPVRAVVALLEDEHARDEPPLRTEPPTTR